MIGQTRLREFAALPRPLRVLVLACFVNRAGMFVFPLLAVYLTEAKHLSTGHAGVLMSVGSTGLLVGSLLSGPACDRAGRRAALLVSLVLNAAGYAGLALVRDTPWQYAAFLFLALVGMGMFAPAANTLIADLAAPEQRPFAYTVSYIANNLGMGIGPLLGGVAAAYSYGLMFAGNIALGLVCAALIMVWVPRDTIRRSRRPEGRSRPAGWRADLDVAVVVVASLCFVVPLIGIEYALPLAVTTVLNTSAAMIGLVYTINSVVVVSAGLFIERKIKAYPTRVLLIVAGALWTAGTAVMAFAFSLPALLLSTVVWTVGEIIVSVVVPTYIADQIDGRRVSRFMALNGFVLSFARLVVPMGFGLLWQEQGHAPVFLALFLVPAVGVLAYAVLPVRRAPVTEPDPQFV
ncbi:MFS transporter [Cryptosporangium aurantiacum]|uniref:Predicted arabinose efflux permease, MFS family n=1 Tax=Cryptosporangium aurantiacum TaxID=134849 RepID=A0A1M7P914_9ACTN|nr:MFS transporter [Cryptosporangium aurantiacum]SHN13279.1 Predicted arabinose efflux permease, MFS family [Cryptosporangium aurantiacum]